MKSMKGLAHIAVLTTDIEKSIKFYERLGGMCTARGSVQKPTGVNQLAMLKIWGFEFEFIQPGDGSAANAVVLIQQNVNDEINIFLNVFLNFIYFWRCWVFVASWAFSSCGEWGLLSSCGVRTSHCCGFSCCREWALGAWVSEAVVCRLNSCGFWALEYRLHGCSIQA